MVNKTLHFMFTVMLHALSHFSAHQIQVNRSFFMELVFHQNKHI